MKKTICVALMVVLLFSIPALAIGKEYLLPKNSYVMFDKIRAMHWIDLMVADKDEAATNYWKQMYRDGYMLPTKEDVTVIIIDAAIADPYAFFGLVKIQSTDRELTGWVQKHQLKPVKKATTPKKKGK